jgi:hypothetical protein
MWAYLFGEEGFCVVMAASIGLFLGVLAGLIFGPWSLAAVVVFQLLFGTTAALYRVKHPGKGRQG